jgi:hypothetical protein
MGFLYACGLASEVVWRKMGAEARRAPDVPLRFPGPLCYGVGMADVQSDKATLLEPSKLIGTWRRFGVFGPVYEIIGASKEFTGGDQQMRVRVVETGEELDYRLAEILDDPVER